MAGDEPSASVTRIHAGLGVHRAWVEIIAELLFLMALVPLGRYLGNRLAQQAIAWHFATAGGLALAYVTLIVSIKTFCQKRLRTRQDRFIPDTQWNLLRQILGSFTTATWGLAIGTSWAYWPHRPVFGLCLLAGAMAMSVVLTHWDRLRSPDTVLEHASPADRLEAFAPLRDFATGLGMGNLAIKLLAPEHTTTDNLAACVTKKKGPIIILSQWLVDLLAPEELLAIFAHEIAHLRLRHGLRTVRLASAGGYLLLAIALFLVSWRLRQGVPPQDRLFLAVPSLLLALRLVIFLAERLSLWVRRYEEHSANLLAVEMTGQAGPLVAAIGKIAAATGLDRPASWWEVAMFARQPSAMSAIARILRHAARKGIPRDDPLPSSVGNRVSSDPPADQKAPLA
jgi:Zn-dependent protease with chaperone function